MAQTATQVNWMVHHKMWPSSLDTEPASPTSKSRSSREDLLNSSEGQRAIPRTEADDPSASVTAHVIARELPVTGLGEKSSHDMDAAITTEADPLSTVEPTAEPRDLTGEDGSEAAASPQPDETDSSSATILGHSVMDLIHRFEAGVRTEQEDESVSPSDPRQQVDEHVSQPSVAEEQESSFFPLRLITKTTRKVGEVTSAVIEGVAEGLEEVTRGVKHLADKFYLPQSSLEENPYNNIHVPHPDRFGGMVGLGMNIQKVEGGHRVRVIPGGLAHMSKLQDNDLIISVNEVDVRDWEFEDLQQFFGRLDVEINIVIEREPQDETDGGEVVTETISTTIVMSVEGDKVVVDVDIKYGMIKWEFYEEIGPYFIYQDNQANSNQKYLTYRDGSFCMAPCKDFRRCECKLLTYKPGAYGARVIINSSSDMVLDHSMQTRAVQYNQNLGRRDLKIDIKKDSRFFYALKQKNSGLYTFECASLPNHFLVVGSDGKLSTQAFSGIKAVKKEGLFKMELESVVFGNKNGNKNSNK